MPTNEAALCRHTAAPSEGVVDLVEKAVSEIGEDIEFLTKKGLTPEEFGAAFPLAIERIRGSLSASNSDRRGFVIGVLDHLVTSKAILSYERPDYGNDTIYRVKIHGMDDVAIIQKGCPDGAHSSTRWTRPDWAGEAYLWWLCDSLTYDPGEHVAKGVNRLRKRFFDPKYDDAIDGVIFHNKTCGSRDRPCPKKSRSVMINETMVPPPCVWVMPKRDGDVGDTGEWNWDGLRTQRFPSILLSAFGIMDAEMSMFTGHVGFQKTPRGVRNKISSRGGAGLVTQYKSNPR